MTSFLFRRLGDRFREHLRDVEKDDQNASKPVARHFNLPNHSNQHIVVCGLSLHQGSTESRKTLEQKFIFEIGLLILTVITNAFHSTNLDSCFSRHQASTNSVAPSFCILTVSFRISLRWPIHIINPVDETKLSHLTTSLVARLPVYKRCSL